MNIVQKNPATRLQEKQNKRKTKKGTISVLIMLIKIDKCTEIGMKNQILIVLVVIVVIAVVVVLLD